MLCLQSADNHQKDLKNCDQPYARKTLRSTEEVKEAPSATMHPHLHTKDNKSTPLDYVFYPGFVIL